MEYFQKTLIGVLANAYRVLPEYPDNHLTYPARIIGMSPHALTLEESSKADLVNR